MWETHAIKETFLTFALFYVLSLHLTKEQVRQRVPYLPSITRAHPMTARSSAISCYVITKEGIFQR